MTGTTQADKVRLRAAARAARRRRPSAELAAAGPELARRVLALPRVRAAGTVTAYVSQGTEPPTEELLRALHDLGLAVLLPVVLDDLDLDWAADDGSRGAGAGPGVPEPTGLRLGRDAVARADVLLVPALLADRGGRRLGQGGGSFDRALARARPDAVVVALVHDDELVAGPLPTHPHDRPVDLVVTPARVVSRGG
jgi:5-formyltetrahydrofolate cyclo-ligase